MPRRSRKKSCQGNKAPLTFAESPVNKQWNVPSPVCCVHHPLTAKTVPPEINSTAWCSPQFGNVALTGLDVRRTRSRRSHQVNNPHCTCGRAAADRSHKVTKFKALKFVGDKSPPVTVIEDVSAEEISEKENCLEPLKCMKVMSPEMGCEMEPRRKEKKALKKSKHKIRIDSSVNDCDNITSCCEDRNDFPLAYISIDTPPHNKETPNHNNVEPVQQLFKDSPARRKTCKETSSKRLFSDRNSDMLEDDILEGNCTSTLSEDEPICQRKLQPRHILVKYFDTTKCNTPSRLRKRTPAVLVIDTPEADYGLPMRLRKLRKH